MPREVKKTPQVRSKPIKKAVLVRPVAKKAPKKVTPRAIKKVTVATPEVVVLPRTASVRLLEKVALYKVWYNDDLPLVVSRVAVGAGYTFVLLGAIFTAFTYSTPVFDRAAQSGATICSDALCTSIPDEALATDAPQVKFENSLPVEIVDTIDFDVSFTTSKPALSLKNLKTGTYTALEPEAVVSDNRLKYILVPKDLPESEYQVVATIKQGSVEYQFEGSVFTVPGLKTEDVSIPDEVELSEVAEVIEETATSTELFTATSSDTQASSTEPLAVEDITVTSEAVPDQIRNTPFARLEDENEASYLVIDSGGFLPERVEIFASLSAGTPLFLGTATAVENDWWFSLDALSLPKVPLMLYGQFVADGTLVQTAGVRFGSAVSNATSTVSAEDEIFRAKVDAALAYLEIEKGFRQQYFSSWASLSVSDIESQIAEPSVIDLANTLMAESASVIDVYLLRYASAHLVGMPTILTLADASIAELSVKLSESVSSEAATALATLIRVRLNLLQEDIRNNERDLKDATNGLIAQDRDNDGFSDYDEIVLYATNPNEADSDSDGLIDSVEIFNTPAAGEYSVTSATAQVLSKIITHPDGTKSTLALIEGQSIPNTHLLITHNDSYVSIVKTGAQGGFSYTIDKPLDGEVHHFTLSLMGTDGTQLPVYTTPTFALNNGALELETQNLASVFSTNFDSTQAATLIASITLTTLGFILLYLAFALRSNTEFFARVRAKKALL